MKPFEKNTANTRPCVRSQKVMDVTWSDCPEEINNIVRDMWIRAELGNDNYVLKIKDWEDLEYDIPDQAKRERFKEYLTSEGIKDGESVWIHWWW